jgi:multiple sugar transport system ATP-binding protein
MGSEFYAYFVIAADRVSSAELEEIAKDAGSVELPSMGEGTQVTARLGADSRVRQSVETELWFDSPHLQLFDSESGESLLADTSSGNGAAQAPPVASSASTPS